MTQEKIGALVKLLLQPQLTSIVPNTSITTPDYPPLSCTDCALPQHYGFIDSDSEPSHLSQLCAANVVSGLDSLHQPHISDSRSQQSPQLHQPNNSSQLNVTNSVDPDNSFRLNNNSDSTLNYSSQNIVTDVTNSNRSFGLYVSDPFVAPDFPSQLYVSNSG
ncbi:1566_t:CDS:2 [Racocetra persica]|uniref:1566_t:CDS:1 n=1 Tax=Racocetra persica TaxID=160502 RepID=A0ACA9MBB7_9GLOM|nr:1566_t:CDS:2 [Racocetra persica]